MAFSFFIVTFGCKVNAYESEAIREELERHGLVYKEDGEADFVLVNTCAVTLVAEKKAKEKIRSLHRLYPHSKIVVLGCFAQLHPEQVSAFDGVELVLGTKDRAHLYELLRDRIEGEGKEVEVNPNSRLFDYDPISISGFDREERAFVKIQDGCDNFCSYCIIPLTRGKSRSRKEEDILEEIKRLASAGYKEIVLTGIDIGSYQDGEKRLSDLVQDILELEEKTFRVRISSLEMSQIDRKYIDLYKNNERLVPHIHIPLQAGSEKVLEAMNRKYDLNHFYEMTQLLKKEIPGVALSTDVITGFPGESEEDFLETEEFVQKVGFMRLHVFPYSRRPYTRADKMEDQNPNEVKKERARRLIKVGDLLMEKYYQENIGTVHTVLVEEKVVTRGGKTYYRGYTENYLDVKVASDKDLRGQLVKGTLIEGGELVPLEK